MEQLEKVKNLYLINLACFLFICWNLAARIILKADSNYKILVLILISVYLIHFFTVKLQSKNKLLSVFYKNQYLFQELEYQVKRGIIIVSVIGLLQFGRDIRFYVIYFVLSILLLRESRAYSYNIKNSRFVNLFILVFTLIMSMDFVFLSIVKLARRLIEIIWIPFQYIVEGIMYGIGYLVELFSKLISKTMNKKVDIAINNNSASQIPANNDTSIFIFPVWAKTIIEILFFLLFIYVVYILYTKSKNYKSNRENNAEVIYEKLAVASVKNKYRANYGNDLYSRILSIFYHFEKYADSKKLYKPSSVAEELGNAVKNSVSQKEAVEDLVNIYNETKFSSHKIDAEYYKNIKEAYNKIKN